MKEKLLPSVCVYVCVYQCMCMFQCVRVIVCAYVYACVCVRSSKIVIIGTYTMDTISETSPVGQSCLIRRQTESFDIVSHFPRKNTQNAFKNVERHSLPLSWIRRYV